jgi:hypothetical protein
MKDLGCRVMSSEMHPIRSTRIHPKGLQSPLEVLPPQRDTGRIKAPFAGTICSPPFSKILLFEHGREAHSTKCVEGEFCELRLNGVLGSSLSSGAARRRLRVRHEALEDGVADAPLEAPQRLFAGFAFRDLLAVVGAAPSIRPGLRGGDHVQGVALSLRLPTSESLWRTTSPLDASTGAVPA